MPEPLTAPLPGQGMPEIRGAADSPDVLAQCRRMIQAGSRSFSLASRLFDSKNREAAFFVYGWCRYCDDQIDDEREPGRAVLKLEELQAATRSALRGEPQSHPVFIAFQQVTRRHGIPDEYPLDLLEGMAMDVRGQSYDSLKELELYCYRVAGTVGLMMTHVMGISDQRALNHAVRMGMAMQLTNICRDVLDDAAMGRVYLPLNWLREAGIPVDRVAAPAFRPQVAGLVRRLLKEADTHYAYGREGIPYLPLRGAFAIAAAGAVYSEIGRLVEERGARAWDRRAVVPLRRKLLVLSRAVLRVLASVPGRLIRPRQCVPITAIWRPL